jgi:uncharacterized repeat protein (TIGR03803 family)
MNLSISRLLKPSLSIAWLSLTAFILTGALRAVAAEVIHYQRLISFGSVANDGWQPWSPLIEGNDGVLYGTTYNGGSNNYGAVFKLNKDGRDYRLLHHFGDDAADGRKPQGGLIKASDGFLYGTTEAGGSHGTGTIFRMLPDGSAYTVMHSFISSEGTGPLAALVEGSDGVLYGTASEGGVDAWSGSVFAINKDGGNFRVLHHFGPGSTTDGSLPVSSLLEGSDGALYGTTVTGGGNGVGSVFKLNKDGSGYTKLYAFGFNDSAINPGAGLFEGSNHALYGTAYGYFGGVFKLNQDGTGYQVLIGFNDARPYGAMISGRDGALYGTTFKGGKNFFGVGQGSVFKLNEDGSDSRVLYSFGSTAGDGVGPHAALLLASDGAFYGTTFGGGDSNQGTVFRLLVNRVPVAKCTNVIVSAGSDCSAYASVDNGSFDPDGDPITLTQSPPGPYPLGTNLVTLTVTDSNGDSNASTGFVIVLDTTPPEIDCPTNIIVEFTSETGAVVSYSPLAVDTCDANPLINCAPISGSVFPIGTTEVHCTASDASGNTATCNFTVTVVGARGVIQDVLSELIALRATVDCGSYPSDKDQVDKHGNQGNGSQQVDDRICTKLDAAIRCLRASLNPAAWIDETHLERKIGVQVFIDENLAVNQLVDILKDKHNQISGTVLQEMIARMIRADRLLASVAIQEAVTAGESPKKINQAEKFLANGDADVRDNKRPNAIEDYGHAWARVLHSVIFTPIHLPNGYARFEIQCAPGETVKIQASSNLVDWTTIGTGSASSDGIVTFEDSEAGKYPSRYYRAVTQ